jgi:hypothetical protein
MTREDFEGLVGRALAALRVADQVTVIGAGFTPDTGAMTAELRVAGDSGVVTGGGTGGSASSSSSSGGGTVTISVAADDDAARMERETRAELRRALRMCPLCERIGHVEKLRRGATGQQEGCAVRCPACGEFEIDQELVKRFRSARERDDAAVLDRLPSLSERTRAGSHVRITADNWRGDAS